MFKIVLQTLSSPKIPDLNIIKANKAKVIFSFSFILKFYNIVNINTLIKLFIFYIINIIIFFFINI